MSDALLQRYYLHAAFTGKEVSTPKDFSSAAALKLFVAANPGAIGCILKSDVDARVKVLKVDGIAPGEPGRLIGYQPGRLSTPGASVYGFIRVPGELGVRA